MTNTATIKHQDGDCLYSVKTVELAIYDTGLDIEIRAIGNRDCSLGFLPPPSLYLENAAITAKSIQELENEEISIPRGWENDDGTEKEDNISRIYIGQHQALDNTLIRLRRVSADTIEITWTADAVDFNYYDERAKRNTVEVSAVFQH